jgi:hypothetical protein
MKTRLTERDLTRIVRRVINEGLIEPTGTKKLDSNWVESNDGMSGTWKIEGGYLSIYIGDKLVASMAASA